MKKSICNNSGSKKFRLTIIGAGGAIGLPASYQASLRDMKVIMIDSGSGAIDNSTHTVHTSIVRPNRAVWPFSKAIESWRNNGPFDMQLSPAMVPFGFHSILQSYCVSENRIHRMWKAFRTLGLESREIYLRFNKELGQITLGGTGRGHISSPLVPGDNDVVLTLRQKLSTYGVKSEILTNAKEIQDYVGRLPVRHPEVMARYPEDFVLNLHQYKSKLLRKVYENEGTYLQDTVIDIERDSSGSVSTVITEQGRRIPTDAVFYAGGWRANIFLKRWLEINLNPHLNVASGVRFALPGHLVDRSIVCGSMFLAPGHDVLGNEITDIGQMFLVNVKDPIPCEKHRAQAIKRFYTYFDYQGNIPKLWNCIGRPVTTTGMPFVERVAPNMVVALGPGMFGVTTGTGLAQRGLDLLLDNKIHPDHGYFERQSGWNILSTFLQDTLTRSKPPVKKEPSPQGLPAANSPRVIQLGRRGAMTGVLHEILAQRHDFAVYGAREINSVIQDIQNHQNAVLLVASHGMHAKLPAHYGEDYISANQAIEKVLSQALCKNLSGIIVISGGIPKDVLQDLMRMASSRGVRFVHIPGLATSMEMLLNAVRSLLLTVKRPTRMIIEDTFHKGKKEIPSAGGSQLLADVAKRFGANNLLILVGDSSLQNELISQYPNATIKVVQTGREIHTISDQFPTLIPVITRSHRIATSYHYQHRLTIHEQALTITFDQTVTSSSQLVPPIQHVIHSLASLPPSFSGTGVSSVLPTITFQPGASLIGGLAGIIRSLNDADAILSVQIRDAEPVAWIRELLLTGRSGEMLELEHDPALGCCLRVNVAIDGQPLSLSLSREY